MMTIMTNTWYSIQPSIIISPGFTLYIYNTKDNFSFIDSILSGSTEPVETTNGDLGGTIIVAGNPDFEKFNQK